MARILVTLFLFIAITFVQAQPSKNFADSICIQSKIPELAYAIVSADSVLEFNISGVQKVNSNRRAKQSDKFRIGSNTKTVTAYLAAVLVKQGKLQWQTKFFDLYPELKAQSNPAYYNLTLQDLITFRANLISWTYTNETPLKKEIKGNAQQQRYNFTAWILRQAPDTSQKAIHWSNPAYVAVGLMLEKATGKSYETLIQEFGKELDIQFDFGQPDTKTEPCGHYGNLQPESASQNYKLNWLVPAGNLTVSLPDYIKFIQLQLLGLKGQSKIFTAEEFNYLHYGLPSFSFGWNNHTDSATGYTYSFHRGNPGAWLAQVYICKEKNLAFIFFANIQSEEAEKGMAVLLGKLKEKYISKP